MKKTVLILGLKGGVGKTLVSIATALKLAEKHDVILIDADLDSPNMAKVMGVEDEIEVNPDTMKPVKLGNINLFSMALLVKDRAISMSGDAYTQILLDILERTKWDVGKDFYIVVDCPAGASDIFRSLIKAFGESMAGAVVVAQPASYDDLDRMLKLLKHFDIPVLGVVDNMAYFKCGKCGETYYIFGEPMGEIYADKYDVPYLGQIPLSIEVRDVVDSGMTIIPKDMLPTINKVVSKAERAKVKRVSIVTKIKDVAVSRLKRTITKIIVKMVLRANKELPLPTLQAKYGLGGNVIELLVTHKGEILIQSYFIIKDGRLKVVERPKKVDISIMMSLETFVSTIRGDINIEDAYYMGEIEVYGSGATVRAIYFFRKVWGVIEEEANRVLKEEGIVEK